VLFEYTLLAFVLVGCTVNLIYCGVTGISPIPSSRTSREFMFSLLPQEFEGEIVELGTGWGTLAFPLANRFSNASVRAYELSPIPWFVMQIRRVFSTCTNLRLFRANFLKVPIRGETKAVICYLHSEVLGRVRPKLERELAPGTLFVSNVFEVPGWIPEAVHKIDCSFCPQVYVYRVPAKVV